MKQFVKALDKERLCFQYMMPLFPQLYDGKLREKKYFENGRWFEKIDVFNKFDGPFQRFS